MPVHFSIGVGNGDADRDLLERYRSGARPAARRVDPARRPPGWPAPSERADDDAGELQPCWAW